MKLPGAAFERAVFQNIICLLCQDPVLYINGYQTVPVIMTLQLLRNTASSKNVKSKLFPTDDSDNRTLRADVSLFATANVVNNTNKSCKPLNNIMLIIIASFLFYSKYFRVNEVLILGVVHPDSLHCL